MRLPALFIIVMLLYETARSNSFPGPVDFHFQSSTRDPFTIHFVRQDSAYALDAFKILSRAYDEISFDLQLDRADSFHVFIMPTRKSFRETLQGRLPSWTGAFANPSVNMMVIKSPRWNPDDSFAVTLAHEFFHLLIHRHMGREFPRWLDEGLAIFYSREERWKKATTLSKALTTGSLIPLSEIDFILEYHQAKADLAYHQSFSAVEYLLKTYDSDALRQIISGIKEGQDLDSCFRSATGSSYAEFEMEWQQHVRQTSKWMWLYELDDYLWLFIFVLLVLALVLRRRHNKKIEEQWRAQPEESPAQDDEEDNLLL